MKRHGLALNHPYYETLTRLLECDSYRRVQSLLLGKDLHFQFEIFHLRSITRLISRADRGRKCYYYWHLHRHGTSSRFLFPNSL